MSYKEGPYDVNYFNGNKAGGYTDFSQESKRAIPRADDIQSYFGTFKITDKVLVIGCAYGYLVNELQQRDGGNHKVIGIDISSYAIGQAKTLFPALTFENIDFFNHTFSQKEFDLIILELVLGSMPDKATTDLFLTEIAGILNTNGMVYALVEANSFYYLIITNTQYQAYVNTGSLIGKSIEITDIGHTKLAAGKRVVIY